jgi:hypothetical protein
MMGRLKSDQGQLFYEFHLGDAVPEDHLVRKIDAALDLSGGARERCRSYAACEVSGLFREPSSQPKKRATAPDGSPPRSFGENGSV